MVSVDVADPEEVRALLNSAHSRKTDPACQFSVDHMMLQGTCWKILNGDAIEGALLTTEEDGALWIMVAAGRSTHDLCDIMAAHLVAEAKGRYTAIGFRTARRGLVKKAQRHGYEVEAYIMRKDL